MGVEYWNKATPLVMINATNGQLVYPHQKESQLSWSHNEEGYNAHDRSHA